MCVCVCVGVLVTLAVDSVTLPAHQLRSIHPSIVHAWDDTNTITHTHVRVCTASAIICSKCAVTPESGVPRKTLTVFVFCVKILTRACGPEQVRNGYTTPCRGAAVCALMKAGGAGGRDQGDYSSVPPGKKQAGANTHTHTHTHTRHLLIHSS
jgi:hypothetical protein